MAAALLAAAELSQALEEEIVDYWAAIAFICSFASAMI